MSPRWSLGAFICDTCSCRTIGPTGSLDLKPPLINAMSLATHSKCAFDCFSQAKQSTSFTLLGTSRCRHRKLYPRRPKQLIPRRSKCCLGLSCIQMNHLLRTVPKKESPGWTVEVATSISSESRTSVLPESIWHWMKILRRHHI